MEGSGGKVPNLLYKTGELKKVRMTAHLNPPDEQKKTRLNEAASSTQIPVGAAPKGCCTGWNGENSLQREGSLVGGHSVKSYLRSLGTSFVPVKVHHCCLVSLSSHFFTV